MPVVPAELYARLRQLDWRSPTFGSDERDQDRRAASSTSPATRRTCATAGSSSPTRSSSCCGSSRSTAAGCSRASSCSPRCGATATPAARAPSTSTCGACAPSSARRRDAMIETVRNVGYKMRGGLANPRRQRAILLRARRHVRRRAARVGAAAPSQRHTGGGRAASSASASATVFPDGEARFAQSSRGHALRRAPASCWRPRRAPRASSRALARRGSRRFLRASMRVELDAPGAGSGLSPLTSAASAPRFFWILVASLPAPPGRRRSRARACAFWLPSAARIWPRSSSALRCSSGGSPSTSDLMSPAVAWSASRFLRCSSSAACSAARLQREVAELELRERALPGALVGVEVEVEAARHAEQRERTTDEGEVAHRVRAGSARAPRAAARPAPGLRFSRREEQEQLLDVARARRAGSPPA